MHTAIFNDEMDPQKLKSRGRQKNTVQTISSESDRPNRDKNNRKKKNT